MHTDGAPRPNHKYTQATENLSPPSTELSHIVIASVVANTNFKTSG